ncbi:MAG: hypothetical protein ACE5G7_05955 [Candidatus Hydrothermarchaeaceae archaeon]
MVNKYEVFSKLFSSLPLRDRPIIVGGSAVEFYTRGRFETRDFDIIGDYKKLDKYLILKGFERKGRHYYKHGILIEIVAPFTSERVKTIVIGKRNMRIISLEDLIVDRLSACVHWGSVRDCEQAEFLFGFYKKNLDRKYLRERAKEEGVYGELTRISRLKTM